MDEIPVLNLLIIGECGVGKSCFIKRYTQDLYPESIRATFAMEYIVKTINLKGKEYKLQIWDKGGGEYFEVVPPNFYEKLDGIMLVYYEVFGGFSQSAKYFHERIVSKTKCPILLVHNKIDLIPNSNKIENPLAEHDVPMIKTSAKTGANVKNAFSRLINMILNDNPNSEISQDEDQITTAYHSPNLQYPTKNSTLEGKKAARDKPCFCLLF